MELKDKTLLEKGVMDEKKSKSGLEKESAAKLFSRFKLDLDNQYKPFLQSSPSCKAAAYSFIPKEKPLYTSGLDIAYERATNPLGSFYDRLNNDRRGIGLPFDFGLMNSFGRM